LDPQLRLGDLLLADSLAIHAKPRRDLGSGKILLHEVPDLLIESWQAGEERVGRQIQS
jgi:hypothetical protein